MGSTVRPQEHFQIRWGTSPFGGIDIPLYWKRVMYLLKIRGDQSPLSLSVPPGMNLVSTWQYNSRIHLARLLCAQRASKPTSAIYRGSPTYTKITNTVSTTTVFGLCMCKCGIFALVGDLLQ